MVASAGTTTLTVAIICGGVIALVAVWRMLRDTSVTAYRVGVFFEKSRDELAEEPDPESPTEVLYPSRDRTREP